MTSPRIRFSAFTGPWQTVELSDVCTINPPTGNLPYEFIYIDLESVKEGRLSSTNKINSSSAPSRAQRLVEPKDILFQTVRPYQQNNLFFEGINNENVVASTGYAQIRATKADPYFLYCAIQTKQFLKNVLDRCAGGTFPSINTSELKSILIRNTTTTEQKQIGAFFYLLEEKINLATRKIELLEKIRKTTTDQIFKRSLGLKKPDESLYETWQECSFTDIFAFLRTKPIPRAHLNGHNSPYNIHYGDILTKYDITIDLQTDELPSISDDINMSNIDVLKEGDLIIADTAEDSSAGKAIEILNTCNHTIYAGLHTFACRPNTKFAPGFLGYYLNSSTYHNQLLRLMTGTKVLSISKAQISTTKILIPTLAEQERIITLLNNLREKTRVQRKKLCALKALKNALLQQMFV